MGNMSYCRFENTYHDLQDCAENINEADVSEREDKYRKKLIELCKDIAGGEEEDEEE